MMEIPNIKPNSNKYREQNKKEDEHRLTKVTKGKVKKNQSSMIRQFTKAFIPEDAKSIKEYVIEETPGLIQSFLRRLFQNILDAYLPENSRYSSYGGGLRARNSRTPYNSISSGSSSSSGMTKSRITNSVYEYDEITFEFLEDAENTLNGMYEWLSRCEKVTVFDLYDLAGYPAKATDRNYGWTDLSGVRIIPIKEGWVIDLPKAIPLY